MTLNIAMLFELGPDDNSRIGGGVELHATNLSKELVRRGHKVTYFTGAIPNCKNKTKIDNLNIKRIDLCSLIKKTYKTQQLNFARQILFLAKTTLSRHKKIVENEDFDIFHGHVYSAGLAAYSLSKKQKAVSINTIHGSYYKYWKQLTRNIFTATFFRSMERRIAPYLAKKSTYQIHTDFDFADTVKKWCKPEIQKKIITVLNGVDTKKFKPEIKPNAELADKEGPIVMTTRRLVTKNGVIFLVRSFKKILKKFPEAELVIIGDGPEKQTIEKEIQKLEIKSRTHLIGMITNDQIPSYLSAADIIVVPSIVEASSISVLEAMAMKKPIVASDIPGIREITNYGKNCKLVSPMNSEELALGINSLLENKEKANEIAGLGYEEILKDYTWEKKAKEIEEIYYKAREEKE